MSHKKDKINFWKAENRQAIDSYDDSECNSRMLEEGSYRFSLGPGKHTQCTKAGVKLTNIVGPTMWADKS